MAMMMAFLMWVAITVHTHSQVLLTLLLGILALMIAAVFTVCVWKATGN